MNQEQTKATFTIGQMARRLGVNARTLRFYESRGLLPSPSRSESGYRLYSEADELLLRFVLRAKRLGFTLEEIGQIVQLSRHGKACGYTQQALQKHRTALDAEIVAMQSLRAELERAALAWQQTDNCDGTFCGLIEGWTDALDAQPPEEVTTMENAKRKVEVFSAGCPLCEPVVEMVRRVACDGCEVTVHNLSEASGAQRAREAGVHRVPMVLVDGQPADCCQNGPVTEAGLRAAGIGAQ